MAFINLKNIVPVILFAVLGLTILFCNYADTGKPISDALTSWPITLATFAVIIGAIEFIASRIKGSIKRAKGWHYNLLSLGGFLLVFIAALTYEPLFNYLISNVISVLEVALYAFIGFYNLILFFRAARARSFEVGLLLISTILVMLWMAPVGEAIHPAFPIIGKWINDVPSGGTMRGILICVAIGMIGLFIRAALGRERAFLGGE